MTTQDKSRLAKTTPCNTISDTTWQAKDKTRQDKTRQDKTWQDKTRQNKMT